MTTRLVAHLLGTPSHPVLAAAAERAPHNCIGWLLLDGAEVLRVGRRLHRTRNFSRDMERDHGVGMSFGTSSS